MQYLLCSCINKYVISSYIHNRFSITWRTVSLYCTRLQCNALCNRALCYSSTGEMAYRKKYNIDDFIAPLFYFCGDTKFIFTQSIFLRNGPQVKIIKCFNAYKNFKVVFTIIIYFMFLIMRKIRT